MLIIFIVLTSTAVVYSYDYDKKDPPPCGVNEEYSECKITCPPQFCNISYVDYAPCPLKKKCEPGCNCIKDHLRDFNGICVLNENCPPLPEETCDVPHECKSTCAEPIPKNCFYKRPYKNIKGCKCRPGFVLSDKDGECVRVENCPLQPTCNGDPNALITKCPPPCPATCSYPHEIPCKMICSDVGCKCKDGFILSKINGLCVEPDNCPAKKVTPGYEQAIQQYGTLSMSMPLPRPPSGYESSEDEPAPRYVTQVLNMAVDDSDLQLDFSANNHAFNIHSVQYLTKDNGERSPTLSETATTARASSVNDNAASLNNQSFDNATVARNTQTLNRRAPNAHALNNALGTLPRANTAVGGGLLAATLGRKMNSGNHKKKASQPIMAYDEIPGLQS